MTTNMDPAHGHWTVTNHAAERLYQMQVGIDEVLLAAADPVLTYGPAAGHPEESRNHCRGRVCAVVNPSTKTIITILWWTEEEYSR